MGSVSGGSGGGIVARMAMAPIKFWVIVVALCAAVGGATLAAAASGLIVKVYGITAGVMSEDASEFGDWVNVGKQESIANNGGAGAPAEPQD